MLAKLGAYVIAYVVLAGIWLPFFPIAIALTMALKKAKVLTIFVISLLDAIEICCGVLIAAWLIHKIGQSPSWLMFLIPGYLMVQNNLKRIERAKVGWSNVKLMHEQDGKPESYDQKHDLWVERGHLLGEVTGWIVGAELMLRSTSFF